MGEYAGPLSSKRERAVVPHFTHLIVQHGKEGLQRICHDPQHKTPIHREFARLRKEFEHEMSNCEGNGDQLDDRCCYY